MRTLVAALLFVLSSLTPVTAHASPADELLERGLRSYAVGRYDDAIAAFRRGYELQPRADFLYALGQAQRMKGDCRSAAASYRAYLRTAPAEKSAAPARQNLERCEHELAAAPTPRPAPFVATTPVATTPVATTPATTAPAETNGATTVTAAPPPRRWQRDRAAPVLAGLGGAALISGAVLWGVGESGARSIADAARYDQFASRSADADAFERERLAGIITVAVGGALVVAGVARWAWVARHR